MYAGRGRTVPRFAWHARTSRTIGLSSVMVGPPKVEVDRGSPTLERSTPFQGSTPEDVVSCWRWPDGDSSTSAENPSGKKTRWPRGVRSRTGSRGISLARLVYHRDLLDFLRNHQFGHAIHQHQAVPLRRIIALRQFAQDGFGDVTFVIFPFHVPPLPGLRNVGAQLRPVVAVVRWYCGLNVDGRLHNRMTFRVGAFLRPNDNPSISSLSPRVVFHKGAGTLESRSPPSLIPVPVPPERRP